MTFNFKLFLLTFASITFPNFKYHRLILNVTIYLLFYLIFSTLLYLWGDLGQIIFIICHHEIRFIFSFIKLYLYFYCIIQIKLFIIMQNYIKYYVNYINYISMLSIISINYITYYNFFSYYLQMYIFKHQAFSFRLSCVLVMSWSKKKKRKAI